jgi:hypothetical protein
MTAIYPTKINLPLALLRELRNEAERESRKVHQLCLNLIAEGIALREAHKQSTPAGAEVDNGVFA